jgi:hypothetical protein
LKFQLVVETNNVNFGHEAPNKSDPDKLCELKSPLVGDQSIGF